MTRAEVENIVKGEIHYLTAEDQDLLIIPYRKNFFNAINSKIGEYWVVLDTDKTSEDFGYLIFYSEDGFGIGTKTTFGHLHYDTGGFVGIYGSLKNAIDNM